MFRIRFIGLCTGFLMIALMLSALNVSPAFAQSEAPATEAACAACHESLYLLHDTGKWYCTCKRRADCTVCHAGQADTFDEDLAHQGLIANPIQDNPLPARAAIQATIRPISSALP